MLARSRLVRWLSCLACLALAAAPGCQPEPTEADAARPRVSYEAMTQGSPAEMVAHLRVLRDRYKAASAEDLQFLREGTLAYAEAVTKTADAVLTNHDATPAQRYEAAAAEIKALSRPAESDPKALDRLLAVADRLEAEPAESGIPPMVAFVRFETLAAATQVKEGQTLNEALFDKLLDAAIGVGRIEPPHEKAEAILKEFAPLAGMKHRDEKAQVLWDLYARRTEDPQTRAFAKGSANRSGLVGKPIGAFAGPKLVGEGTLDLDSLKGKVVLVDFWASWCAPCMAEMPALKALRDRLAPQGFEIVGVSIDADPAAARTKAQSSGMDWPLIDDQPDFNADPPLPRLGVQFGTSFIPLKLLIDREGRLVTSGNGLGDVETALEKLIPGAKVPETPLPGPAIPVPVEPLPPAKP